MVAFFERIGDTGERKKNGIVHPTTSMTCSVGLPLACGVSRLSRLRTNMVHFGSSHSLIAETYHVTSFLLCFLLLRFFFLLFRLFNRVVLLQLRSFSTVVRDEFIRTDQGKNQKYSSSSSSSSTFLIHLGFLSSFSSFSKNASPSDLFAPLNNY